MIGTRSSSFAWHTKGPQRVIAFITLWSFLFFILSGDLLPGKAWADATVIKSKAYSDTGSAHKGPIKALSVETFSLPKNLGQIKDYYRALSGKTIVHIQDAHCNYFAQHKVNDIIAHLQKAYDIDIVNLEGGTARYDLSIFADISDSAIREKISDYFVRQGLVNGPEYFAINNPGKVALWGIEDPKLYAQNLSVYKDSLAYKNEVDKVLESLTHVLNNLKLHMYTADLLDVDKTYLRYKANNMEFKDYLTYIIDRAWSRNIDIKSFTNIYLLKQTLGLEDDIDFKKANQERDMVIDILKGSLSKKDLEILVLKTVAFKSEQISQPEFYSYLAGEAKSAHLGLSEFRNLEKYIMYITLYNAIDKSNVMHEIGDLETAIKETLFRNDKERELDQLSTTLALTKNLFNITLTRIDYRYYKDNKALFNSRNYTAFINREAPLYNVTACPDKNIDRLDHYRESITEFYECSFKRDRAFIDNIRFGTSSSGQKVALLVTGGFHTDNLSQLFKENNISYVSIIPSFMDKGEYECPYFNLLAGNNDGILKKIYPVVAGISSIQIYSRLSPVLAKEIGGDISLYAFRAAVQIMRITEKGKRVRLMRDAVTPYTDADGAIVEFGEEEAELTGITIADLMNSVGYTFQDKADDAQAATDDQPQAAISGETGTGKKAKGTRKPAEGAGSWFASDRHPVLTEMYSGLVAWWFETIVAFGIGTLFIYCGAAPFAPFAIAGTFFGLHLIGNREALKHESVPMLAIAMVIAAGMSGSNAVLFSPAFWGVLALHGGINLFIFIKYLLGVNIGIIEDITDVLDVEPYTISELPDKAQDGSRTFDEFVDDTLSERQMRDKEEMDAERDRQYRIHAEQLKHVGHLDPLEDELAAVVHEVHDALKTAIRKEIPDFDSNIYVIDDDSVNAYIYRTKTEIFFHKGLFENLVDLSEQTGIKLTKEILAYIIAHELAHGVQNTTIGIGEIVTEIQRGDPMQEYFIQMSKNVEFDADAKALNIMDRAGYTVIGAIDFMKLMMFTENISRIEMMRVPHARMRDRIQRLLHFIFQPESMVFENAEKPQQPLESDVVVSSRHINFRKVMNASDDDIKQWAHDAETLDQAKELLSLYALRTRMRRLKAARNDASVRRLFAKRLFLDAAFTFLRKYDNNISSIDEIKLIDFKDMRRAGAVYDFITDEGDYQHTYQDMAVLVRQTYSARRLSVNMRFDESVFGSIYEKHFGQIKSSEHMKNAIRFKKFKKYFDWIEKMAEEIDESFLDKITTVSQEDAQAYLPVMDEASYQTYEKIKKDIEGPVPTIEDGLQNPHLMVAAYLYKNVIGQEASTVFRMGDIPVDLGKDFRDLELRIEKGQMSVFEQNPAYRPTGTKEERNALMDIMIIHFLSDAYAMSIEGHIEHSRPFVDGMDLRNSQTTISSEVRDDVAESLFTALERTAKDVGEKDRTALARKLLKYYLGYDFGIQPETVEELLAGKCDAPEAFYADHFLRFARDINNHYMKSLERYNKDRSDKKKGYVEEMRAYISKHRYWDQLAALKVEPDIIENLRQAVLLTFVKIRERDEDVLNYSLSQFNYMPRKLFTVFSEQMKDMDIFYDTSFIEFVRDAAAFRDQNRELGVDEFRVRITPFITGHKYWDILEQRAIDLLRKYSIDQGEKTARLKAGIDSMQKRFIDWQCSHSQQMHDRISEHMKERPSHISSASDITSFMSGMMNVSDVFFRETGLVLPSSSALMEEIESLDMLESLPEWQIDWVLKYEGGKVFRLLSQEIKKDKARVHKFIMKFPMHMRKSLLLYTTPNVKPFELVSDLYGEEIEQIIKGCEELFGSDSLEILQRYMELSKERTDPKFLPITEYLLESANSRYIPMGHITGTYFEQLANKYPVLKKDFSQMTEEERGEARTIIFNAFKKVSAVSEITLTFPNGDWLVYDQNAQEDYLGEKTGRKPKLKPDEEFEDTESRLHYLGWSERAHQTSNFVLGLLELSVEQLREILEARRNYHQMTRRYSLTYRGAEFVDRDYYCDIVQAIILRKLATEYNAGSAPLTASSDSLDSVISVEVRDMRERRGKSHVYRIFRVRPNHDLVKNIPFDVLLDGFGGYAAPSDYMDTVMERYIRDNNLESRYPEYKDFLLDANQFDVSAVASASLFKNSRVNAGKTIPYTQAIADIIDVSSARTSLFVKYQTMLGRRAVTSRRIPLKKRFELLNEAYPGNSPVKDQMFDDWEKELIPEYERLRMSRWRRLVIGMLMIGKRIPLIKNIPVIRDAATELISVIKALDTDFEKLRLIEHLSINEKKIVDEVLPFYEMIIPNTFTPQRAARFGATAFFLWQKTRQAERAAFRARVTMLLHFMPEPSVLRDQILRNLGDKYSRSIDDAMLISDHLYVNRMLVPNKDYRVDDFIVETVASLFSTATRKEKAEILLWVQGARTDKPEYVKAVERNFKIHFDTLPRDILVLPASIRDAFIESFMLGDNGLLDPQSRVVNGSQAQKDGKKNDFDIMKEYLERMFMHLFPEDTKELDIEEMHLLAGLFATVMETFQPYRRVMVMKEFAALRSRPDFEKTSIGERLAVLLGALGPVGIKVAQYLSENENLVPGEDMRRVLGELRNDAPSFPKIAGFGILANNIPQDQFAVTELGDALGIASIKQVHGGAWIDLDGVRALMENLRPILRGEDLTRMDYGYEQVTKKEISLKDLFDILKELATKHGIDISKFQKDVVYKLRRPSLGVLKADDFRALDAVKNYLQKKQKQGWSVPKTGDLIDTVKYWINTEMNFYREQMYHELMSKIEFRSSFQQEAGVVLKNPKIYHCTESVMVEERVKGITLMDLSFGSRKPITLDDIMKVGFTERQARVIYPRLARMSRRHAHMLLSLRKAGYTGRELTEAFKKVRNFNPRKIRRFIRDTLLHQIFVDGVFHADVHQGNVMITPDGEVYMIDRGNVGIWRDDRQKQGAKDVLTGTLLKDSSLILSGMRNIFKYAYEENETADTPQITKSDIQEILDRDMNIKSTVNALSLKVLEHGRNRGARSFAVYMKALTQAMHLFPTSIVRGPGSIGAIAHYIGMNGQDLKKAIDIQGRIYLKEKYHIPIRFSGYVPLRGILINWAYRKAIAVRDLSGIDIGAGAEVAVSVSVKEAETVDVVPLPDVEESRPMRLDEKALTEQPLTGAADTKAQEHTLKAAPDKPKGVKLKMRVEGNEIHIDALEPVRPFELKDQNELGQFMSDTMRGI